MAPAGKGKQAKGPSPLVCFVVACLSIYLVFVWYLLAKPEREMTDRFMQSQSSNVVRLGQRGAESPAHAHSTAPQATPGSFQTQETDTAVEEGDKEKYCRDVTGEGEGYWTNEADGGKLYHMKNCKLRRFTTESARACLKDRHVLFIGDSVTRFQYTAFVHLLLKGYPEPTGDKGFCVAKGGWGENFWRTFFLTTSKVFEGRELCDCFRPKLDSGPAAKQGTVENRHFSIKEINMTISYIPLLNPNWGLKGFYPGKCRNHTEAHCTDASMTKQNLMDAAHVLTEAEFDQELPSLPFPWWGPTETIMRRILPHMQVDTLFLNSGLWGELTDAKKVEEWFKAGSETVCRHKGNMCLWKHTTTSFRCPDGGTNGGKCAKMSWQPYFTTDKIPKDMVKKYGWKMYDTETPTKHMVWQDMVDNKHFKPFVYNELNNILLNEICPEE